MENFIYPKDLEFLSSRLQMFLVIVLFVAAVLNRYRSDAKNKDSYSINFTHYFAPIYEEIIFRGILLPYLLIDQSVAVSIIVSSLLFGIWHLKNIEHMEKRELLFQILYAALIIGPLLGYIAVITGTIWVGVILHYLNNVTSIYIQPMWQKKFNGYIKN